MTATPSPSPPEGATHLNGRAEEIASLQEELRSKLAARSCRPTRFQLVKARTKLELAVHAPEKQDPPAALPPR